MALPFLIPSLLSPFGAGLTSGEVPGRLIPLKWGGYLINTFSFSFFFFSSPVLGEFNIWIYIFFGYVCGLLGARKNKRWFCKPLPSLLASCSARGTLHNIKHSVLHDFITIPSPYLLFTSTPLTPVCFHHEFGLSLLASAWCRTNPKATLGWIPPVFFS